MSFIGNALSGIGSTLFGSGPKVQQLPPTSNIQGSQQGLLAYLAQQYPDLINKLIQSGSVPAQAYGGQFTAPVTPQQTELIDQLTGGVQPGAQGPQTQTQTLDALSQILGGGGPTISIGGPSAMAPLSGLSATGGGGAPGGLNDPAARGLFPGGATSIGGGAGQPSGTLAGQPITGDQTTYFQNVVARPLQQMFTDQTLPALQGAFARSAGGTYSGQGGADPTTGFQGATNFALRDLLNSESMGASNLAFQTQESQLGNMIKAAALEPGVQNANLQGLNAALGAATVPQQTQQAQLTAQYADFVRQQQARQQALLQALGFAGGISTPTTQQTATVGFPATPGLLSSFLGGSGAGPALGAIFGGGGGGGGAANVALGAGGAAAAGYGGASAAGLTGAGDLVDVAALAAFA